MIGPDATARQLYFELRETRGRPRYAFGNRPALINVDLQNAYTRPEEFATAYAGGPDQFAQINRLGAAMRRLGAPVIWSYVAFWENGEDCGVFGSRDDDQDSQQNVKHGSRRAVLDSRLEIAAGDILFPKRMPSVFHETNLQSLLVARRCDSVIVTGGSTSGCVRATVVDAMSRGYLVALPVECVADRHESPHFANLYNMEAKYARVDPVADILAHLAGLAG